MFSDESYPHQIKKQSFMKKKPQPQTNLKKLEANNSKSYSLYLKTGK